MFGSKGKTANEHLSQRSEATLLILAGFGVEGERFRLEWVFAAEGPKFAEVVRNFTEQVQKLGPSPYKS